eukprot:TRINITY_DN106165_c0_g1_i1.p1 TRINITY_DN106165_c0_g1~~TRINITY_DN106165_c0_g1_i1.p1  ORF type:complete len:368 (-),score=51.16 TRINITY_DN106165_c0_g1_i1:112-1176(-)
MAAVLCDCPFFPEFQALFDAKVRCFFVTELLGKGVDELTKDDMAESVAALCKRGDIRLASDIVAVVSHQHAPLGPETFDLLPSLRVVSNHGVGYGHIDSAYLRKRGVPLGYTPGAASAPTGELGAGLILASARNIVASIQKARDPATTSFNPYWYGQRVAGTTLGIVGFGELGQSLAAVTRGFGMKALYYSRSRKKVREEELGVDWCEGGLDELLRLSDFVALCVSSSPETRGMIGARELALMKPSATLVNIARGDIVVQDALVAALQGGKIAAAALDVTTPEPLPRDHPLLHMENVIVTSHIGSATRTDRRRMAEMCLENLLAGLEGRELPTAVHQSGEHGAKRKAPESTVPV